MGDGYDIATLLSVWALPVALVGAFEHRVSPREVHVPACVSQTASMDRNGIAHSISELWLSPPEQF